MAGYKNSHPTIGEAAKILGISKRQMEHLYLAGMTPAVRRDKLGRRRYPPIALQQAQRAIKRDPHAAGLKDKKTSLYLFVYVMGALIALLTKPETSSLLGVTLTTLLLNYVFKIVDTQVSERFKGNKKGVIVIALGTLALLLGVATVYLAPMVGEYLKVNQVCAALTENIDEAFSYPSTDEDSTGDNVSNTGGLPGSTPVVSSTSVQPSTESPTAMPTHQTPELPVNPSATPPTAIPTNQPPSSPVVPSPTSAPTDLPTTEPTLPLPTPIVTDPPSTAPVPPSPTAETYSTYHKFDGQGNCREATFPDSANPTGWVLGKCP